MHDITLIPPNMSITLNNSVYMHDITLTPPNMSVTLNNRVLSPILCKNRQREGCLLIPVGHSGVFGCVYVQMFLLNRSVLPADSLLFN